MIRFCLALLCLIALAPFAAATHNGARQIRVISVQNRYVAPPQALILPSNDCYGVPAQLNAGYSYGQREALFFQRQSAGYGYGGADLNIQINDRRGPLERALDNLRRGRNRQEIRVLQINGRGY